MIRDPGYCARDNLYVGYGASGFVLPPADHAGDDDWLASHCWGCGRDAAEVAADPDTPPEPGPREPAEAEADL